MLIPEVTSNRGLASFGFSGNPTITSNKFNAKNYLNWSTTVKIWFHGQRLYDHLIKNSEEIDKDDWEDWEQADFQLVSFVAVH